MHAYEVLFYRLDKSDFILYTLVIIHGGRSFPSVYRNFFAKKGLRRSRSVYSPLTSCFNSRAVLFL